MDAELIVTGGWVDAVELVDLVIIVVPGRDIEDLVVVCGHQSSSSIRSTMVGEGAGV